jgi:hypothetical protein
MAKIGYVLMLIAWVILLLYALISMRSRQDKWETQQLVQEFKKIVGVIIVLATPLSVNALSRLLSTETINIKKGLDRLHSILNIPDDLYAPVRLLHLSFQDFLLDIKTKETKESEQFWIDEKAVH